MLLPYADTGKIQYILSCNLLESDRSSFNTWADGVTTREQFWSGISRYSSDGAVLSAVYDYVIHEIHCLEHFTGVHIDANISVKNTD